MCTVTVIPSFEGWRLVCNRDEQRTRAVATPPSLHAIGRRRVVMPVDPPSGGTWIAINDAGVAMVLVNLNETAPLGSGVRATSRGLVIPSLAGVASLDELRDRVEVFDTMPFSPFRLVALDRERCVAWRSTAGRMQAIAESPIAAPLFFTSSGLGDALVEGPRRALFVERLFTRASPSEQDAFHAHAWSDRPHLSVCMAREDARTVSVTTLELRSGRATVNYREIGGHASPPIELPIGPRVMMAPT